MTRRSGILMWVGVGAAPIAWAFEHGAGFSVAEANCNVVGPQWGVSFSAWIISITAATAVLAAAGLLAAILSLRAVSGAGEDDDPPAGRVWLMSIFGIIISPILLVMILISGVGALLLDSCRQV